MTTEPDKLKHIVEAALLAAGRPLTLDNMLDLFDTTEERPDRAGLRAVLETLGQECAERGVELKEVASGYRYQVRPDYAQWIGRLWLERPARYSRALLETLALIAYRQPITRGEIEDIRGVAVSTSIMKTLQEREWIRVLGHREVPGRPAMYGTTRAFLDHFNLKSLDDLPPLKAVRDLDRIQSDLFGDAPRDGVRIEAGAPEEDMLHESDADNMAQQEDEHTIAVAEPEQDEEAATVSDDAPNDIEQPSEEMAIDDDPAGFEDAAVEDTSQATPLDDDTAQTDQQR